MSSSDQRIRDVQHFGEEGGVVPVIDVAATSTFLNPEDMARTFKGELQGCYLYSRHSNPSVTAFGKKLAALEGAEAGTGTASGISAIHCTVEQIASHGDHLLSAHVIYGGTYAYFKHLLPRRGVEVELLDLENYETLKKRVKKNTKILYAESMSNPLLNVAPFENIKKFKKEFPHIKIIIDNTFAPLMIRPLEWGADVVVHSCTKFISGASDMIAGAIAGSKEFINELVDVNHGTIMLYGPVMDARLAQELYLRLDHLKVRMCAHSAEALHLAKTIEKETKLKVIYPGLAPHPHHERLKNIGDMSIGFGGMLTLGCGSQSRALKLAAKLQEMKFGLYAVSLGFSRTLISCPAVSTSSEIPEEEQKKISLEPSLLRLSIGFTGDRAEMTQRFLKACQSL